MKKSMKIQDWITISDICQARSRDTDILEVRRTEHPQNRLILEIRYIVPKAVGNAIVEYRLHYQGLAVSQPTYFEIYTVSENLVPLCWVTTGDSKLLIT